MSSQTHRGFGSDNHASVHPEVMTAIAQANAGHAPAYGQDAWSQRFHERVSEHFGPRAHAVFVFNGTAANVLALRALLASHEAVITADSSHLAVDECGAPEFHGGHKILTCPTSDGKLTPELISRWLVRRGDQHAVQPRMVSITQPTEWGTCYTLAELKALRDFTRRENLMLHMDGARLGNAAAFLKTSLGAITSDIDLDALSLGGTKNGLMGAEALIFFGRERPAALPFIVKQEMQLASKTRFLAAQLTAYLDNQLWRRIADRSLALARELRRQLATIKQIEIVQPTESNAVFARLPRTWIKPLKEACFFYVWDERQWIVRLMLSHDNDEADIARFINTAKTLAKNQE